MPLTPSVILGRPSHLFLSSYVSGKYWGLIGPSLCSKQFTAMRNAIPILQVGEPRHQEFTQLLVVELQCKPSI